LQEKPASYLKTTLQDQMSALDEMTKNLREKGLVISPVLSETRRTANNPFNTQQERPPYPTYDPY
jgi:hypothetical protein